MVTAVAMLVTGWVSSRIGAKSTLIVGLVLIVVFAALAGASGSIGGSRRSPSCSGLAAHVDVHVSFWIAAGAVLAAIAVLATGHRLLSAADARLADGEAAHAGEPGVRARAEVWQHP